MTTDLKYNEYILNYLGNDRTKSAIMLSAPWGMGKSYYINNSLIPYLEKENNKKSIVVSLYGINDIKEISKAIYLEIRLKPFMAKSERSEVGNLVGKTIIKGILNRSGIDISLKEEDFEKLYSSIDLSGRLIIFEDLERSGLSVLQVLGYVNNIVEQDGAKVLLVVNEAELKKTEPHIVKDKDGNELTQWVYTAETNEYLRIKEKTVSETILYTCDYDAAIENIIKMFSDYNLNFCLKDKDAKGDSTIVGDIKDIMTLLNKYNLRSLIFACQKTMDIFSCYTDELDMEFFKHVLLGNIAFALRLKDNEDLLLNDKITPGNLGVAKYPLQEFCYDYIKYQRLDVSMIKHYQDVFKASQEYERQQRIANTSLSVLYDFPRCQESAIRNAVKTIKDELTNGKVIPLDEYGKLANYLIAVKYVLEERELVDDCKCLMANNLAKPIQDVNHIIDSIRIHSGFELWNDAQKQEYQSFTEAMLAVLQTHVVSISRDGTPLSYLEKIIEFMAERDNYIRQSRSFMRQLDIEQLIRGLEEASAEQVSNFRRGILSIYRIANIQSFLPKDKDSLIELQNGVKSLIENERGSDKVVRLQYTWLVDNLQIGIDNYH